RSRSAQPFQPDSAVTLYWDEEPLAPGAKRELGFTYGLGQVASSEGQGKLLLTLPNHIPRDSEFTLTALVRTPAAGEKLTLTLPPDQGFTLLSGSPEQVVPPVPASATRLISPVTWRIK